MINFLVGRMADNQNEDIAKKESPAKKRRGAIRTIVLRTIRVACEKYDTGLIREIILEDGSYVNGKDVKGNTPLFYAVKPCALEIMKLLLSNGADVNERCQKGYTPLTNLLVHAQNDPEEGEDPRVFKAAKLLLEAGANPNVRDDMGFPLWLHYMLGKRNIPDTGELLLKHGLETNVKVRLISSCRNIGGGSSRFL